MDVPYPRTCLSQVAPLLVTSKRPSKGGRQGGAGGGGTGQSHGHKGSKVGSGGGDAGEEEEAEGAEALPAQQQRAPGKRQVTLSAKAGGRLG